MTNHLQSSNMEDSNTKKNARQVKNATPKVQEKLSTSNNAHRGNNSYSNRRKAPKISDPQKTTPIQNKKNKNVFLRVSFESNNQKTEQETRRVSQRKA